MFDECSRVDARRVVVLTTPLQGDRRGSASFGARVRNFQAHLAGSRAGSAAPRPHCIRRHDGAHVPLQVPDEAAQDALDVPRHLSVFVPSRAKSRVLRVRSRAFGVGRRRGSARAVQSGRQPDQERTWEEEEDCGSTTVSAGARTTKSDRLPGRTILASEKEKSRPTRQYVIV
jgi:hypothetical protein